MKQTFFRGIAMTTVLAVGIAASALADTSYSVEINKGKLVRLANPATSVVVADSDIADVQVVSPKLVYISGRQVGETSVLAIDGADNVVMEGTVAVTHNLSNLKAAVLRSIPDAKVDFASTDSAIILRGDVQSPVMAEKINRLAKSFVTEGQNVINMLDTKEGDQVMLKVKIAEVSRTELKRFGINLESVLSGGNFVFGLATGRTILDTATGAILRNANDGSLFGGLHTGSGDVNGILDALEDDGLVSILAEPNLTTKSGVAANFLAGGEFPIPVVDGDNGVTIEYRQFGVSLDFTPVVLSAEKISLSVRPEVSTLSSTNAIQTNGFNIPTLLTRRASTTVELGSGESFAIAGLLRNDNNNDVNKVPGLGDLPVLGALFKSNEFRQDQSELVIIITPYIVHGVNGVELAAPTDGYSPASDADRILMGKSYKETPHAPEEAVNQASVVAPMRRHYPRVNGATGYMMR